jgi:hypothetical protein
MTVLRDPDRLSYANKDLDMIDADVERYISSYIPTIRGWTKSNEGRMFLRILEAILDMLNYSVDMQFRESNIDTVLQYMNLSRLVKLIGYKPLGYAGASTTCTFTMASGVAPAGGQAIPLWTVVQKSASPAVFFVTSSAATIPEGQSSLTGVPVVQGYPVTASVLSAAASGDPDQQYSVTLGLLEDTLSVYVGGELWDKVDSLVDSGPGDMHYEVKYDTSANPFILFGDGVYGAIPPGASAITADYVWSDGEDQDVGPGEIDVIGGALASTVVVINPDAATGGYSGDGVEEMRRLAPQALRTIWRAVTAPDLVDLAKQVSGVYSAKLKTPWGNSITMYVVPTGGGVAGAPLLTATQEFLTLRSVLQGDITCESATPAQVRIKCHVVAQTNRISKTLLKSYVESTLRTVFEYDQFDLGDGYTVSEVGDRILDHNNGATFKSVDFEMLTKWPRVEQSNIAAPNMAGNVQVYANCGYDTWTLTATSAANFQVAKNGVIQSTAGTVGVEYVSAGSEISFTLGATTDVLGPGDTWTITTSKYSDNLDVAEDEHMSLAESDMSVFVYYPGEYDVTA